jgi:F-type H+-transporting ATPase subunit a
MLPHDESWLSLIFSAISKTARENFEHAMAVLLGDAEGHTWLMHNHVGFQHVYGGVFILLVLTLIGLHVRSQLRDVKAAVVPEDELTLRTFMELLVGTTYKMMSDMMGAKAAKFFLPLIGTCALFILFSNASGLVPGFLPPTDNLNTTLAMALVIFFTTHIYGVKEHGLKYFKHFLGPIWWLAPLMVLIEIIGHLARPASLSIRLGANMTADHMVLAIFTTLVPFVVPLPMYALGLIVVTVQTLVFCLLSTVYISLAISHEEH